MNMVWSNVGITVGSAILFANDVYLYKWLLSKIELERKIIS